MIFDLINWAAFVWFVGMWVGYTIYAKHQANKGNSLSAVLHGYRNEWMKNMLGHENRIPDMVLLGNLTTMVNFLASTSILIIAGLVTVVYSADNVLALLSDHAFIVKTTKEQVEFKLIVLIVIFVFAFFKFTWCMRQHTFCAILLGAAPYVQGDNLTENELEFAKMAAKVSDRAGHEFNYGLRSYYFGMAAMTWFINPPVFFVTTAIVVFILHHREFRSTTLKYLKLSRNSYDEIKKTKKKSSKLD